MLADGGPALIEADLRECSAVPGMPYLFELDEK
jgi:hypothetical protein